MQTSYTSQTLNASNTSLLTQCKYWIPVIYVREHEVFSTRVPHLNHKTQKIIWVTIFSILPSMIYDYYFSCARKKGIQYRINEKKKWWVKQPFNFNKLVAKINKPIIKVQLWQHREMAPKCHIYLWEIDK